MRVLQSLILLLALLLIVQSEKVSPFTLSKDASSSASFHRLLLRLLTTGDFAEFNRLFADATLALPDADVSRSGLTLRIRNLICQEISVDNMHFNHTRDSASRVTAGLFVDPFAFKCKSDYSYSFSFFRGSGRMEAKARNNRINAQVSLTSPTTFAQDPPATTAIVSCGSKLDIYDMTFRGGLVARIVDLFENLIDNVIEREIQKGTRATNKRSCLKC